MLNVCIRTDAGDGKYNYILFNQFVSDNSVTVSHVTGVVPDKHELKDANLLVYLNKNKAKAQILEAKLEIGNSSSLY